MHDAFAYHKLNASGQEQAKMIAEQFNVLLIKLRPLMSDGRTAVICMTKLEEACFFAKKSMAMDPNNQDNT